MSTIEQVRKFNDEVGVGFVNFIANMKPRGNKKEAAIVSIQDAPRKPRKVTPLRLKGFERKIDEFFNLREEIIGILDLPIEDASEINFAQWLKPYRIAVQGRHPTLFLFNRKPDINRPGGDRSALHGTREIRGVVRPFEDLSLRVVQTIEAEISTFYLLWDEWDILPDENEDYTGE